MLAVASDGSRDVKVLKHAALLVMKGDYIPGSDTYPVRLLTKKGPLGSEVSGPSSS